MAVAAAEAAAAGPGRSAPQQEPRAAWAACPAGPSCRSRGFGGGERKEWGGGAPGGAGAEGEGRPPGPGREGRGPAAAGWREKA